MFLSELIDHDTFQTISHFCGKDIKALDACSKQIGYHQHRYYLLKHYIRYMLNIAKIPYTIVHYNKIKKQLTDLTLIDYFIYIMARLPTIVDISKTYSNSELYILFKPDLPTTVLNVYKCNQDSCIIKTFLAHISDILCSPKIILLNMYSQRFSNNFNIQYNTNCLVNRPVGYLENTNGCLLMVLCNLIPTQCIENMYLKQLMFYNFKYFQNTFIHFPDNTTYINLLKISCNKAFLIKNKNIKYMYFNKLRK